MPRTLGLSNLVSRDAAINARDITFLTPRYPCRRIADFEAVRIAQGRDSYVSTGELTLFAEEIADKLGVTVRVGGEAVSEYGAHICIGGIHENIHRSRTVNDVSSQRVAFHALYLLAAELCLQVQSGGRESIGGMVFDIEDMLYIYSARVCSLVADDRLISETYRGLIWLNRLLAQVGEYERSADVRIAFQGRPMLDRTQGAERSQMLFALSDVLPPDDFDSILLGGWELFRDGDLEVAERNGCVDIESIVAPVQEFLSA